MNHKDIIYGQVSITNPIALEIIESPSFQRLKDVDMGGYFEVFYPGSSHSRFDHSIWVYILLNKYGASTEEQIAGLIHDISHGAFSHCLDYVFAEWSQREQTHQDSIFEDFIKMTDIPKILEKHNMDIDFVLDDKNFPLKETLLPDLCADRIDYILRWAIHYDKKDNKEISDILSHLLVRNNTWVFGNANSAKEFAKLFKKINDIYYSDISTAIMFQTTSDFLKHAVKKSYIIREDLYTTDKIVLAKIMPHIQDDKHLSLLRERMNNKTNITNNPTNFDVQVFCKNRIVDPLFVEWNDILRVSDISTEWKEIVENAQPKEYFLKFEK